MCIVNYCVYVYIQFQGFQFWMTLLHYASMHGYSEVVEVLISYGATVDMKDKVSIELYGLHIQH